MVSIVSCAEGTPCVKETLISRLVTKSCTSTLLLICLFEEKSHRLRKKKGGCFVLKHPEMTRTNIQDFTSTETFWIIFKKNIYK